jgi:hypothetical protein
VPGGQCHHAFVWRADGDPARTVEPAVATDQLGTDALHVGVDLAGVVPVRHVAVATAEDTCRVDRAGDGFAGAVDAAGVVQCKNRSQQRLARHAAPVRAFAADEFAFHDRDLQPRRTGPSSDVLANRSCSDNDDVVSVFRSVHGFNSGVFSPVFPYRSEIRVIR